MCWHGCYHFTWSCSFGLSNTMSKFSMSFSFYVAAFDTDMSSPSMDVVTPSPVDVVIPLGAWRWWQRSTLAFGAKSLVWNAMDQFPKTQTQKNNAQLSSTCCALSATINSWILFLVSDWALSRESYWTIRASNPWNLLAQLIFTGPEQRQWQSTTNHLVRACKPEALKLVSGSYCFYLRARLGS